MPTFSEYISRYEHEHRNPWNKRLHAVGIPVIFAGLILLLLSWQTGLGLFVLGWMLLFLGHRIEGNKPAVFQGPVYFLAGPVWVVKEIKDAIFGRARRSLAER